MFSSSWILPGPIRPSASRSIRTLRDGSGLAVDFCIEADFSIEDGLSLIAAHIATGAFYEQDEPNDYIQITHKKFRGRHEFSVVVFTVKVGRYQLKHRVMLAPLTRMRAAKPSLAPRPLNAEYYAQRATPGGLLIAEASPVMASGFGSPGVPGIYTDAQVAGWREVVDAVHAKGGLIFLQFWHVGRVSHSSFQPGGVLPVAPSAVAIPLT